ncbi:uncharacterized protein WCC33_014792 [Rhinophrynus dorsalis]
MLMNEVSSGNVKGLDEFYNELRRKYPNTFTLASDLGKRDRVVQRLPRLESTSPAPFGCLPKPPTGLSPQRWAPDSFLYKVQVQKTRGQQQEPEPSQRGGGSVIIQDKTISVPAYSKRDHLGAQNLISFRLPSLRTQVEHNKAELKSRLNTPKDGDNESKGEHHTKSGLNSVGQSINTQSSNKNISSRESPQGHTKHSLAKPDPLGTIMKELLPNKPGRLINDLPKKSRDHQNKNGGYISDSDSGVSVCAPIKIFRPKLRSPQGPPAPSDIIKKFSVKPKTTHGPMRADHTVIPEMLTQSMDELESINKNESKKTSSIIFNEKPQPRLATTRVRFEDESAQEAESRHQERCLLKRKDIQTSDLNSLSSSSTQSLEGNKQPGSVHVSSPPNEKLWTTNQQMSTLPYRRQPFPPSVAKKVLIDIPRSGQPNRRTVHKEMSEAGKNLISKQQLPPRYSNEATSLDGISMSFTSTDEGWRGHDQRVTEKKEDKTKVQQKASPIESKEKGIIEDHSNVTIKRMEWGGSGSSITSESQESTSNHSSNQSLDEQPVPRKLLKGAEKSFYSKMKKNLNVRMRRGSETRTLNASNESEKREQNSQHAFETESRPSLNISLRLDGQEKLALDRKSHTDGSTSFIPAKTIIPDERVPSTGGYNKKMDIVPSAKTQATDPPPTLKVTLAPFLRMRMMQAFLKKGRAKNYMIHEASPPLQDLNGPRSPSNPSANASSQATARLLNIQSDSSRMIELQRPKNGFRGLYLAKRSQNIDAGVYVVQLSSAFTSNLPQGILQVGDEILEINRRRAKDLCLEEINSLLEESSCVLLHVLPRADSHPL